MDGTVDLVPWLPNQPELELLAFAYCSGCDVYLAVSPVSIVHQDPTPTATAATWRANIGIGKG